MSNPESINKLAIDIYNLIKAEGTLLGMINKDVKSALKDFQLLSQMMNNIHARLFTAYATLLHGDLSRSQASAAIQELEKLINLDFHQAFYEDLTKFVKSLQEKTKTSLPPSENN